MNDNVQAAPSGLPQFSLARPLSLMVVSVIGLAFKSPDSVSVPQFWAEDGVIFFKEQYGHVLPQLWVPYAGYLHVIPRLVAFFASFDSAAHIPRIYNVCALLIGAGTLAYIALRLSPALSPVIVFGSVFLTPTNGEIFGTITNVQWLTNWALIPLCFLPATKNRRVDWFASSCVLLIALTGPFSVFYSGAMVGLIAVVVAFPRVKSIVGLGAQFTTYFSELSRLRISALFAGAAIQLAFVLSSPRAASMAPRSFDFILDVFGVLLPPRIVGEFVLSRSIWLSIFAIVFLLLLVRMRSGRLSFDIGVAMLAALFVACVETYTGCLAALSTGPIDYADIFIRDRYFAIDKALFWWVTCLALGFLGARRATELCMVLMVLVAIAHPDTLRRAPLRDMDWRGVSNQLSVPGHHDLQINPSPWSVPIDN